jgi:hypothetical protein
MSAGVCARAIESQPASAADAAPSANATPVTGNTRLIAVIIGSGVREMPCGLSTQPSCQNRKVQPDQGDGRKCAEKIGGASATRCRRGPTPPRSPRRPRLGISDLVLSPRADSARHFFGRQ